jgi:hypothetical protein
VDRAAVDDLVLSDDDWPAARAPLGADHDYRACFIVRPLEGRNPATGGADAFCQPCPRCDCRHTRVRAWTPPSGECPAALLADQVAKATGVRDPAAWSQYTVCMYCDLCGVGARAPQPCPGNAACGAHSLRDFVCEHVSSPTDPVCAPCREAGKGRPCPCNVCQCARLSIVTHPKTWRLGAHARIKERATKTRNKEILATQMPAIGAALRAKGVTSRHVEASIARAIIGGQASLPVELRDLARDHPSTGGGVLFTDSGTRGARRHGCRLRARASEEPCSRRRAAPLAQSMPRRAWRRRAARRSST